jgi:hypothetical protein
MASTLSRDRPPLPPTAVSRRRRITSGISALKRVLVVGLM